MKRFQPTASQPYWYEGGLYALPDTQSFYIMYYRKDIFDQLKLDIPKTWTEFLDCSSVIQRNNMKVYVPYTKIATTTTVNTGLGGLNLFATFLAQNNVNLYDDAQTKTNLGTAEAISAFGEWTNLYTDYKLEKQIDFYNRFRTGTVPLGIGAYTIYTQLKEAAPEIEGRWSIAEVPGILQEDGTINNQVAGAGTGCGILQESSNKEQAWEFLKWWTSEDIQYQYSTDVETILGTVARTATANKKAFNRLSWNSDDLVILNDQWDNVSELPELPGGYYVSRAIDQAYWEVLNGQSNTKDAMFKWSEVADNEIKRKIEEYANK